MQRPIRLILLLFTVLALSYSTLIPIFEAQDELFHYAFADHLATTWQLPVQPRTLEEPLGLWEQEGGQPPLAYWLAAFLISPIDRQDFFSRSQHNPFAALGVARSDEANLNAVLHDPAQEAFPWHGTVLALHLARLLSIV